MITEKQKIIRMKSIGSSDAPAILGVDRWRSSYDLWLQKTGQVPPTEENNAMRLGTILEAPLLALAGERLGLRVVRPSSSYIGNLPIFRANIDGMIGEARRGADLVEVKTTGITDGWGAEMTDEIPEAVKVQVSFQMACSSSALAYVACLSGSHGLAFKIYRLPFDAEFSEYVMSECAKWWELHMIKKIPPVGRANIDLLKQIRRTDTVAQLPQNLFEAESEAKAKLKIAEAEHASAQSELVTALGANKRGECGAHSVTVTEVQTERFDRKAFAAEHAELEKLFVVPSVYNRIDVRKKKESNQ